METRSKARRPPSLPPFCRVFPGLSSFLLLKEGPLAPGIQPLVSKHVTLFMKPCTKVGDWIEALRRLTRMKIFV
jgi:hypothetical protein